MSESADLTHLQIVIADANNTAMIYACRDAAAAQAAVDEWKDPLLRAFTVIADNGVRYNVNSDRTLYVEQVTGEEAKKRLDAFQAARKAQEEALAQAEAEARAAAARQPFVSGPKIMPVPGRIR
jgi:hypothetical protein